MPQPSLKIPQTDAIFEHRQQLNREADAQPHVLDIAYGPDYWQKIDIYLPEAAPEGTLPTLLFMHGGYWTHGY
ncbi:hypothetical protein C2W62_54020, partial [Candidatus Entotheonella serta]